MKGIKMNKEELLKKLDDVGFDYTKYCEAIDNDDELIVLVGWCDEAKTRMKYEAKDGKIRTINIKNIKKIIG